jgi:hypothetical protein
MDWSAMFEHGRVEAKRGDLALAASSFLDILKSYWIAKPQDVHAGIACDQYSLPLPKKGGLSPRSDRGCGRHAARRRLAAFRHRPCGDHFPKLCHNLNRPAPVSLSVLASAACDPDGFAADPEGYIGSEEDSHGSDVLGLYISENLKVISKGVALMPPPPEVATDAGTDLLVSAPS